MFTIIRKVFDINTDTVTVSRIMVLFDTERDAWEEIGDMIADGYPDHVLYDVAQVV